MSDLVDMPTIRQRALPVTVEQYYALAEHGLLSERAELLEGIIVEKMPKSPLHAFLVVMLMELLRRSVSEGFHVRSEQPITCRHSVPEPDLLVVRGTPHDYLQAHPKAAELAVEIAISSSEIDRRKTAIYAEASVREYWIVMPETRQVEVHTKLTQSRYAVQRIFTEGQTAFSEVLPAFRVELDGLFPR